MREGGNLWGIAFSDRMSCCARFLCNKMMALRSKMKVVKEEEGPFPNNFVFFYPLSKDSPSTPVNNSEGRESRSRTKFWNLSCLR